MRRKGEHESGRCNVPLARRTGRRERVRAARLLLALLAWTASLACGKPAVLVVGLDGADWGVLEPLIEAGTLPTIGGLVQGGARAEMSCVPADPASPCFCPPSWTSIATGRPATEHLVWNFQTPSDAREVAAIWNVASDNGAIVTLSSWRGTWPPEPGMDYVFTEPGLDALGEALYEAWQTDTHIGRDQPETLYHPVDLPQSLGVLPHSGERPPSWGILARDRAAMRTLLDLVARLRDPIPAEPRADLTMVILHGGDKVGHLLWGGVQTEMWAPILADNLIASAEAWDGPIELGPPWGWGTVVGPYLEADAWLAKLLAAKHYDYVVFVSDHGMTHRAGEIGFVGDHGADEIEAHHGIFAISGPGVVPGAWLPAMSVLDVAPTLAYVLGLPVAEDLPGRVLAEAFTFEHLATWPIVTTPTWE